MRFDAVAFSVCGGFLAAMIDERSFRIWGLGQLLDFSRHPRDAVTSPNGSKCSANAADLPILRDTEARLGFSSEDIVFSPDTKICATRLSGQSALWVTATGICKIRLTGRTTPIKYLESAHMWAFSPDSSIAITILDEVLVLVNIASSEPPAHFKMTGRLGGIYPIVRFAFSQESTLLAISINCTPGVDLIDVKSGSILHSLRTPDYNFGVLAFSPSGRLAAGLMKGRGFLLWNKPYTANCIPIMLPEEERGFFESLVSAFDLFTTKDTRWRVNSISWSPGEESMVVACVSWHRTNLSSLRKTAIRHYLFEITGIDDGMPVSRLLWSGSYASDLPDSHYEDLREDSGPIALCVLDGHHFAAAWPGFFIIGTPDGCFSRSWLAGKITSFHFSLDRKLILINGTAFTFDNPVKQQQTPCLETHFSRVTWKGREILLLPDDASWNIHEGVSIAGCLALGGSSGNVMIFSVQTPSGGNRDPRQG